MGGIIKKLAFLFLFCFFVKKNGFFVGGGGKGGVVCFFYYTKSWPLLVITQIQTRK